ncbi:jacalin-related lectin Calsepa-like [Aegilops tauschii subsp. strangulata]|uniref:jacalin-related lectin Calsepa-like n=1 Tax=Aegilops tauschii subsp. strangulata TaxID=200361 RepID=UPI003CC87F60
MTYQHLSRKCPECSVTAGFGRCYAVDQILRAVRVPCPNAARGCPMQAGGVVRMGPCGGGGGNDRKIGMVGEVTRIVQVAVRHCALLLRHGLATVTINDNPKFRLQRDEYLTSVEGPYSHFNGNVVIRSLKFVSNLRTHGPYGNACGVRFSLPAGAGGRIVGFHARCDDQYLHAIGTYVKMDDRAS